MGTVAILSLIWMAILLMIGLLMVRIAQED